MFFNGKYLAKNLELLENQIQQKSLLEGCGYIYSAIERELKFANVLEIFKNCKIKEGLI